MKRIIHIIKQYDIVITAFKPALARVILISIGIAIGMIVTYTLAPTVYRNNAVPAQLGEVYRDQWVKNAAGNYANHVNDAPEIVTDESAATLQENAVTEIRKNLIEAAITTDDIARLSKENEGNALLVGNLDQIKSLVNNEASKEQRDQYGDPGFFSAIKPIIVYILVVVVIVLGAIGQVMFDPWIRLKKLIFRPKMDAGLKAEKDRRKAAQEAAKDKSTFDTPPVVQFMSTYLGGDNFYDDSFAIEMEDNTFLGECGSGIAETIGVGDPKKVTAIEAWIFDKNDIQTITHLLMSEHAYNDEALRAKLAPRGEPVLAEPGATTTLETQTLRAEVRVKSVEYGDGALPPNSFFDRLIVEIAVWQKEGSPDLPGGSGGGPNLPPPIIDIPNMETEPPAVKPVQPLPQARPPQGGPPQAPPQQRPPQGMPPPQARPPQGGPPPGVPQQRPPQGMPPPQARPPQGGSPPGVPQQRPPQGMPPTTGTSTARWTTVGSTPTATTSNSVAATSTSTLKVDRHRNDRPNKVKILPLGIQVR